MSRVDRIFARRNINRSARRDWYRSQARQQQQAWDAAQKRELALIQTAEAKRKAP